MRLALLPHPDFSCTAVVGVESEAERSGTRLRLRYRVEGATDALAWPAPAAAERTDGLWRHSCFEAFVARATGDGYVELNFSPSTEWAAYRFDGYRSGMAGLALPSPAIAVRREAGWLQLEAEVELGLEEPGPWQIGLSAVIEDVEGRLCYWALRHPPGRPDFHHRHCFAAELPPAG